MSVAYVCTHAGDRHFKFVRDQWVKCDQGVMCKMLVDSFRTRGSMLHWKVRA